jgi:renalase
MTVTDGGCEDLAMFVVVIGAGMAGLSCARELVDAGHRVVVLDKGRGVGGRMATRRVDNATFDHGAQFFTVRSDAFASSVNQWQADQVVFEWSRGFRVPPDGYPRFAARNGMTALAKHLARGMDVRLNTLAFTIRIEPSGPVVVLDDASEIVADAVVSTCPLPQTYSLLSAAASFPRELLIDYHRTLALLVTLDGTSAVPASGAVNQDDPLFSMIADNHRKGISAASALTFHANNEWSLGQWDAPPDDVHRELLAAAQPWFADADVVSSQLKRWRFATPQRLWAEPCWSSPDANVVLAGDAFAGPNATASNLEGAFTSGRAAAARLLGTD